MPRVINVVCVGPTRSVRGGISRIIEMVKERFPDHIRFRVVGTYSAFIGRDHPDRGSRLVQTAVFVWALLRICFAGVFSRRTVFHVHLAQRGSTLRKGIVCTLLRILRCRYIVQGHASEDILFSKWVPKPARYVLLWGIRGAQYIVALTGVWSDYYVKVLKCSQDRMMVLPNPAELPISVPDRTNRNGVGLLFLGRIGERKGAFELIRSFAALPNAVKQHCRLTLAGDGDAAGARELSIQLGCECQTSVLGWVGRDEVDRLLAEADVFVLPSRGEGMSAALLEGMAWGLAIVSSAAGGATEFLQPNQNSIIVEPGNVQGITDAIYQLVEDRPLRLRLGRNARKTASRFSLEKYVGNLACLYEQVARNEPYMANETIGD